MATPKWDFKPVGLNPTTFPLHPHFFPPLIVESDAAYPLLEDQRARQLTASTVLPLLLMGMNGEV